MGDQRDRAHLAAVAGIQDLFHAHETENGDGLHPNACSPVKQDYSLDGAGGSRSIVTIKERCPLAIPLYSSRP